MRKDTDDQPQHASNEPPILLTPKATTEMLGGISERTLANWRCNKSQPGLPWVVIGNRIRYRRDDVVRFINSQVVT